MKKLLRFVNETGERVHTQIFGPDGEPFNHVQKVTIDLSREVVTARAELVNVGFDIVAETELTEVAVGEPTRWEVPANRISEAITTLEALGAKRRAAPLFGIARAAAGRNTISVEPIMEEIAAERRRLETETGRRFDVAFDPVIPVNPEREGTLVAHFVPRDDEPKGVSDANR